MPLNPTSYRFLSSTPHRRGTTGRRYRFGTERDLSPGYFSRQLLNAPQSEVYDMAPDTTGVYTEAVPTLPSTEGTPTPGVDLDVDPIEARYSTTAGALKGLGMQKALGLGLKGALAAAVGLSPQTAMATPPGPLTALSAANIVGSRAYGDYVNQRDVRKAMAGYYGTEEDDLSPEMQAAGLALADRAKTSTITDPSRPDLGLGISPTSELAASVDDADVRSRHMDRPMTGLVAQGVRNLAPESWAGTLGIRQDPLPGSNIAARDVYGMSQPGFGFADVPASDLGPEGLTVGDPEAPSVGEIDIQDFASPTTPQSRRLARQVMGIMGGRGGQSDSAKYGVTSLDIPEGVTLPEEDPWSRMAAMSPVGMESSSGLHSLDPSGGAGDLGGYAGVSKGLSEEGWGGYTDPTSKSQTFTGVDPASPGGKGTFLCTELYRQGLMPKEIYQADSKYGKLVNRHVYEGYAVWAQPLAEKMEKSKALTAIVKPFVLGWARNMARRMGVQAKFSMLGAVVELVGTPACYLIGAAKARRQEVRI